MLFLSSFFRKELFSSSGFLFSRLLPAEGGDHRDRFSRRRGRSASLLHLPLDDLPQPLAGKLPLTLLPEQGFPVGRLFSFGNSPFRGFCPLCCHRRLFMGMDDLRVFLILDLVSLPALIPVREMQLLCIRDSIPPE